MDKLTILGMTGRRYVKIRAETDSISILKKIAAELESGYFVDNHVIPKTNDYEKWKDQWIPVVLNNMRLDIICGDKMVHILVDGDFDRFNSVLEKYAEWVK